MAKPTARDHRFMRGHAATLRNWNRPVGPDADRLDCNAVVDCGWGRLIFAHTFNSNGEIARTLCDEKPGKRDIAMYLRDPHVVISLAPHEVFLDPSHTYRLWLDRYHPCPTPPRGFQIRRLLNEADAIAMRDLYAKRHMVPSDPARIWAQRDSSVLTYGVAVDGSTGKVIGTATGVDHVNAFNDPEGGASLWCLAVDPQANHPGVGEALVRFIAEHYLARGRTYLDLSVLHDNHQAIGLYEKLGFVRTPVFALKHKNPFNEPLFIAPSLEAELNPYAMIIINEARRRGIAVEVLDAEANYFSLSFGGRTIVCRESLSELTSAIAMSRCDDKRVTTQLFKRANLAVPAQQECESARENAEFLARHRRLVVKPTRGEQGAGISVDVRDVEELERAVERARRVNDVVLLEQYIEGEDLRIIVINNKVVAAAVRKPASVTGTGQHRIADLIEKQSRRRAAATGGESRIPIDSETHRCISEAGYTMDTVLAEGETLIVRRTSNLHTGGTIHDVTGRLHRRLVDAAIAAARSINIPVVGFDFLVPRVDGPDYVIIEANERPGLANHEPQPTAQRFIDLLFPQTKEH